MNPRILMVVTSSNRMGNTDKPTGLWAEELAVPYYALVDAGASVVIASTAGGKTPIDPGSVTANYAAFLPTPEGYAVAIAADSRRRAASTVAG